MLQTEHKQPDRIHFLMALCLHQSQKLPTFVHLQGRRFWIQGLQVTHLPPRHQPKGTPYPFQQNSAERKLKNEFLICFLLHIYICQPHCDIYGASTARQVLGWQYENKRENAALELLTISWRRCTRTNILKEIRQVLREKKGAQGAGQG